MEDLAHRLAGGGKAKALRRLAEKFPTADIGEGDGTLRRFVRPRDLD